MKPLFRSLDWRLEEALGWRFWALLLATLSAGVLTGAVSASDALLAEVNADGEYLSKLANCSGCHTAIGGAPMAGGRVVESPYGSFVTPNITADESTGIGRWTNDDFYTAMSKGLRPDGASLYPVCPFPSYSKARREDIDAIYNYLRALPAVRSVVANHQLRRPYRWRALLKPWRWLFLDTESFSPDRQKSPQWNRGAYLVEGLGHCGECHNARNTLGAPERSDDQQGAIIHGWHAAPFSADAGVQYGTVAEAAELLTAGKNKAAVALGPMAQVVFNSLQYLSEGDALAMASYLHSLPIRPAKPVVPLTRVPEALLEQQQQRGPKIYAARCASCHGKNGEGLTLSDGSVIALAGNRAVQSANPLNLIQIIAHGGYPAGTKKNPRPLGMPPFRHTLSDAEIAAVISFIRGSWGNKAAPVADRDIGRYFER